jgi:hypothetical protein
MTSTLIYVVDLVPERLEILPSDPYTPARFPLLIIIDRYRGSRRVGKGWDLGLELVAASACPDSAVSPYLCGSVRVTDGARTRDLL